MKKIYAVSSLFFFLSFFGKTQAQCPDGNITFVYQQDVDHFVVGYPNCTHINGTLNIGELGNFSTTVSDISGLSSIVAIDGNLNISNTLLTNLQGLQNLSDLNGNLSVNINNRLTSLEQLSNVTETRDLVFTSNQVLTSLSGLQNLSTVKGDLRLMYNPSLQNLSLSNLDAVEGYFEIIGNTTLNSVNGLNNLTSIGSFMAIAENNQLANIEAFGNLTNVEGTAIRIESNPMLTSLNGIQNVNLMALEGSDVGLRLKNNQSLNTCNLPNVCNYLNLDGGNFPREILGNTGNCTDEQAVLATCNLGINENSDLETSWNIYYSKQSQLFFIQSNDFLIAEIQVFNLNGQLMKEIKGGSSHQEQFNLNTNSKVLIVRVVSNEGKTFSKKLLVN